MLRLMCEVRGGHRWQVAHDEPGYHLEICERCGTRNVVYTPGPVAANGDELGAGLPWPRRDPWEAFLDPND